AGPTQPLVVPRHVLDAGADGRAPHVERLPAAARRPDRQRHSLGPGEGEPRLPAGADLEGDGAGPPTERGSAHVPRRRRRGDSDGVLRPRRLRADRTRVVPRGDPPRGAVGVAGHASARSITSPSLSVSRSLRPLCRNVSRLWLDPSRCRIVACTSWTWVFPSAARRPTGSVAPSACPPFTPPPASHIENPCGLWSRPFVPSLIGVRPNSPPQTTSVSLSSPRRFRSVSKPATGRSLWRQSRPWLPSRSEC